MKRLLILAAGCILLMGVGLRLTEPDAHAEVPVLYWVIDPAPARSRQINAYHMWLIENGYCQIFRIRDMQDLQVFQSRAWSPAMKQAIRAANPDGAAALSPETDAAALPLVVKVPGAEMRLDAASNDINKKIIQGVAGVAGDVIDAGGGGKYMTYLASAGMLAALDQGAREYGFTPDTTYTSLSPALFHDGKQYAFPRNVSVMMYWVNADTFRKYDQPLPPSRWSLDEFERRGKAFVAAARANGADQSVFFADRALVTELRRGMGLSALNETMTACTLDDPRNAKLLARIYKWTYEDRIIPSPTDKASFVTEGGWGGAAFQLFRSGRYGMLGSGRWAVMQFRTFGALSLAVVEPPHDVLPNVVVAGGQATIYALSPNRKYAELFLAYMAGEAYNMDIVYSGDALPPNPEYTRIEAFLRPPDFPNEWGCHGAFADAANSIGIAPTHSPFILSLVLERIDNECLDLVMNGLATSEEAARIARQRVDEEIKRNIQANNQLKVMYERQVAVQAKIDRYRSTGRKVPPEWVTNPFHQRLYAVNGWLEQPEGVAVQ